MVLKRNGDIVKYDKRKIRKAICGANKDANPASRIKLSDIDDIVAQVDTQIDKDIEISVEEIQDLVEDVLMCNGYNDVAREYIKYRTIHEMRRKAATDLMESYNDLLFADAKDMDLKRDNANINTNAPMGIMLKVGAEGMKTYVDNYLLDEETRKADKENFIHIHDKDFSAMTLNCLQSDLKKLFKGGFNTGHGFLREPNSIRSAASLACISIQSSQNDMFGGQSIAAFDYVLAPYVKKSFKKAFASNVARLASLFGNLSIDELQADVKAKSASTYGELCPGDRVLVQKWYDGIHAVSDITAFDSLKITETAWENACEDVEDETFQAMEAVIHNFNSLHSRAGSQVPFSSINFGLDTSPEGRLITDKVLDAIWNGLGNGETPIFPISIYTIKEGVNYNPGDPNYDLFKKAMKVSAKRLFPNFNSADSSFNLPIYKADDYRTWPATMGCRTRVATDVNGPDQYTSRGNFSFTTINLPKLALEARKAVEGSLEGITKEKIYKDENNDKVIEKFFKLYDKYIKLSKKYLEYRFDVIAHKKAKNFPFLMGQGLWEGSEKLGPEDEIGGVLKHSSLSIGFCGLAECLVALIGRHHAESEDAQALGLKIVGHLRDMTDKFTKQTHMNWSCFGTPAESTAGSFAKSNQKAYGIIPGITDRIYITNSSHCPVYYPIKAIEKIKIEAPYHKLENAGHIAYIEMDGDPLKNLPAFEAVIRAMHDNDMGYFSINHPVDRDPVCGYTGIIDNECPHCHRKDIDLSDEFVINKL